MSRASAVVLAACVLLVAVGAVQADGKFFFAETVPSNLPYQRAILSFVDGTETLIVQSKYELSATADVNTVGWVVPVPAAPELASMDARSATECFWMMSLHTRPHVFRISHVVGVVGLLALPLSLAWLVLGIGQLIAFLAGRREEGARMRQIPCAFAATVVSLIVAVLLMPTLSASIDGVEVLKSEQVGIYDATVIRGDSAEPVMEWLGANGFEFGDEDKAVFADYVSQGWCFVTAKVRADAYTQSQPIMYEGLADPLVLTFAAEKPVYPLALTATAGAETTILLYTISDTKLTCGQRLPLRGAQPITSDQATRNLSVQNDLVGHSRKLVDLPGGMLTLCKFKGTMTAAQMAQDLTLEPAPDNDPYKERLVVW